MQTPKYQYLSGALFGVDGIEHEYFYLVCEKIFGTVLLCVRCSGRKDQVEHKKRVPAETDAKYATIKRVAIRHSPGQGGNRRALEVLYCDWGSGV